MPTKKQMNDLWASQFRNPWMRRVDDPMYIPPHRKDLLDEWDKMFEPACDISDEGLLRWRDQTIAMIPTWMEEIEMHYFDMKLMLNYSVCRVST